MKKFIPILATLIVLCVPAFADNEPSFASQFQMTQYNVGSPWYVTTFETDSSVQGDVYFYSKIMDGNSVITEIYAISDTSNARAISTQVRVSDDYATTSYATCDNHSNGYYFSSRITYYQNNQNNYTFSPNLSVFPSTATDADIASAFTSFLNTPQTPTVFSTFTVPRGNVLYFQVASEQDINLTGNMPNLSYLIQFGQNQYGPWGDTGIMYGEAASLPSAGTKFPLASQSGVRWFIDAGSTNVLGQSKTGVCSKHCLVGQWYALFCPDTSPQILDAGTNDHAIGASVTVSGSLSQIKVYPLSESINYDGGIATFQSSSNDDYTSYFDGTIDENGNVTWTDQDGSINSPSSGGQNLQTPEANAEGLLAQIRTLLTNIVKELKNLFTFGYEAINDLVDIMSDFVNVLSGLYTWLPSPVYSALISAIVVAIVIGVFKVFL